MTWHWGAFVAVVAGLIMLRGTARQLFMLGVAALLVAYVAYQAVR